MGDPMPVSSLFDIKFILFGVFYWTHADYVYFLGLGFQIFLLFESLFGIGVFLGLFDDQLLGLSLFLLVINVHNNRHELFDALILS